MDDAGSFSGHSPNSLKSMAYEKFFQVVRKATPKTVDSIREMTDKQLVGTFKKTVR